MLHRFLFISLLLVTSFIEQNSLSFAQDFADQVLADLNDPDQVLTSIDFERLRGVNLKQKPELEARLLQLLADPDNQVRQQLLSMLSEFPWEQSQALKQKVLQLQQDPKQKVYVRKQAIMLMGTFHWHDHPEAIAGLAKLLGQSEYRELALTFFLSKLPLSSPRAMQSFSEAYLKLSDHERLQMIADHTELFAKLYHPYAEPVVLKDLERILFKYHNQVDDLSSVIDDLGDAMLSDAERMSYKYEHDSRFLKIIELLHKKLEHPIARNLSFEFLKVFYLVKRPLHIGQMSGHQLGDLLRYPDIADSLSAQLRELVTWGDLQHPLYNEVLEQLDNPKLRGQMNLADFIKFIKCWVPVGKLSSRQVQLLSFKLRQLKLQLSTLEDASFIAMRSDLKVMVEKRSRALSLAEFNQKHASFLGQQHFDQLQTLFDFLYDRYQGLPDLSAQIQRLETLERYHELYPHKEAVKGQDRELFIRNIEQSLHPRQALANLRDINGPERPELGEFLRRLRSEGSLVLDGPNTMSRSAELRQCMVKALARKHY